MKLITFAGPFNHTVGVKKFKLFTLIPTLEFVIDKQCEPYYNSSGEPVDGWNEYSLGFLWLIFAFWIEFNFPKKIKPMNIKEERELLSPPGDTILETLEHLKITSGDLAEAMNITQSSMDALISGKQPITETDAIGLQQCLGIDKQFWLSREKLYRDKLKWIEEQEKKLK